MNVNNHKSIVTSRYCNYYAAIIILYFSCLSQTNKTIRRIKTDFVLDASKALEQVQESGTQTVTPGRSSSWHGTTQAEWKEAEFNSSSTDITRYIVSEKESGDREHTMQERTLGIIADSAAGDASVLLTKSSFLERTNSHERIVTGAKITRKLA